MATVDSAKHEAAAEIDPEDTLTYVEMDPKYVIRAYLIAIVLFATLLVVEKVWQVDEIKGFWLVGAPFLPALLWMAYTHGLVF